jgi:epoxyqueuosine reductase
MDYERFNARNDAFNRVHWDRAYSTARKRRYFRSMLVEKEPGKVAGYTQRDYALRNAGWTHANNTFLTDKSRRDGFLDLLPVAGVKHSTSYQASPEELTKMLKRVAHAFGIDQLGVTATNLQYHHSHRFDYESGSEKPPESVEGLDNCIVIGIDMPYDVVQTYPSVTAGASPGYGYSKNILAIQTLVQYIRHLGYDAVGSLNDTAQCIPYGEQAGLGEYGRNGLLINPKFGPRFRIGKIFTNMPLTHNQPQKFGVVDLCNVCRKCTNACPPRAIPNDAPSYKVYNISNVVGVKKWTVDAEKCFGFWSKQGTECGICIRVCPFNKDLNNLWHKLYGRFVFDPLLKLKMFKLILFFENVFKFDRRLSPKDWWNK